ncbi:MAG: quinolinate synthase NadA, partial [Desulfopila sp.]
MCPNSFAPVEIPTVHVPDSPVSAELSPEEERLLTEEIKQLLTEQNGVLVAHYYTSGALQDLAEETGGCVADSLEMARFG